MPIIPNHTPTPIEHPAWCERTHGDVPVHSGQVGADVELTSELSWAVYLFQQDGKSTEVQLMQHTPDETSLTGLRLLEAGILRDLLAEALGLVADEVGR